MGRFDNVKMEKMEMPNSWDFAKQKTIVGILVGIEENVGPNASKLYTLDTDDGKLSVWGSTVIDMRLKNAEIGEVIKINFLGKEKSEQRKGASYNNFEVFHGKLATEEDAIPEEVEFDLDNIKKKV